MGKARATAEYRFNTKKGYIVLSSTSITEKQGGKPIRLIGILQDITERKRSEEELRAAIQQLRASELQLKGMVNAMSGREVRMVELKDVIKKLRKQLTEAEMKPVADDPLIKENGK